MSFTEKYKQISNLIKNDIENIEKRIKESIKLSDSIDEILTNFLTHKAKRIRPILACLYLRSNNLEITNAHYDFLTAIEIIHNASLIHDDVVDDSELRRGSETLNKKFNNKVAILTGDYLLSNALAFLNKINSAETIAMCADTLSGMCQGEVEQYFNKFKITTIEDYLNKTEKKTAKLFQTAINGSLILSGISTKNSNQDFGYNFGMAFQICDDLLNLKNYDKLKPTQNDIESGIYNAPVIFSGQTEDLTIGFAKTESLLNNYINNAETAIKNVQESDYKKALLELLGTLNNGKI